MPNEMSWLAYTRPCSLHPNLFSSHIESSVIGLVDTWVRMLMWQARIGRNMILDHFSKSASGSGLDLRNLNFQHPAPSQWGSSPSSPASTVLKWLRDGLIVGRPKLHQQVLGMFTLPKLHRPTSTLPAERVQGYKYGGVFNSGKDTISHANLKSTISPYLLKTANVPLPKTLQKINFQLIKNMSGKEEQVEGCFGSKMDTLKPKSTKNCATDANLGITRYI